LREGKYIVIEGQDGTGKTTQATLLQEYLTSRGISSIHIKEPGGSPVAEAIRSVILNGTLQRTSMTNTLLFTANRHELWHAVIQPALGTGTWVICTRNFWSTLAYQGYGEGMDLNVIEAITSTFTNTKYMNPDLGLILSFGNTAGRKARIAERGNLENPDTFESKETDFQQRVQDAYPTIAKEKRIDIIDASGKIETINKEIISMLLKKGLFNS
jgi:dTMP kinase